MEKFPFYPLSRFTLIPTLFHFLIVVEIVITNKIIFPLYVNFTNNTSVGELIIDRTKWNIKYGSSSFFDDLGDRDIYNYFILNFHLFSK